MAGIGRASCGSNAAPILKYGRGGMPQMAALDPPELAQPYNSMS
jgi:hypothetical protein